MKSCREKQAGSIMKLQADARGICKTREGEENMKLFFRRFATGCLICFLMVTVFGIGHVKAADENLTEKNGTNTTISDEYSCRDFSVESCDLRQ